MGQLYPVYIDFPSVTVIQQNCNKLSVENVLLYENNKRWILEEMLKNRTLEDGHIVGDKRPVLL
jgi:tRNA G46 methylase TrmB